MKPKGPLRKAVSDARRAIDQLVWNIQVSDAELRGLRQEHHGLQQESNSSRKRFRNSATPRTSATSAHYQLRLAVGRTGFIAQP